MGRLACGRNRIACCRTAGVGRASIHIRYHAVFIRFYRIGVDGVALGGVGQDAERIAGVQDAAGLLGAPAHLVDVCLQNHLHIGDLIGKIAPGGLQVNDRADLAGGRRSRYRCGHR